MAVDTTRESFQRCVSEPLAIVSIFLQGMQDHGPSRVAYEHVLPYLNGNACHVQLSFDFASPQGQASFLTRLNTLVDLFETGSLQRCVDNFFRHCSSNNVLRFRRFLVFLTSHSDPDRGDLHTSPSGFSAPPAEVSLTFALRFRWRAHY
jgi:hypothetical protein